MFLERKVIGDWIVVVDTRSGVEVVRVSVDPSKRKGTLNELSAAIDSRAKSQARQQAWEAAVVPSLWATPVTY